MVLLKELNKLKELKTLDRDADRLQNIVQYSFGLAGSSAHSSGTRIYDQSMGKARHDQAFDVVGDAIVAALDQCQGLCRAK